jgi:DNA-binding transcriptional regulator YiaG
MPVNLHKNARTPRRTIRRERRGSTASTAKLARLYNPSKAAVRKWRQREESTDRFHRLQTIL